MENKQTLPVIDISCFLQDEGDQKEKERTARTISDACRELGFFYIKGHQIDPQLFKNLDEKSRQFFALNQSSKERISMEKGGIAWRGWFPLGGELTSGRPDRKEGFYLGTELGRDNERVKNNVPLHGSNLWPEELPEMKEIVENYMDSTTKAAHALLRGIALSLGLEENWFYSNLTKNPTVLFRIFHYPPEDYDNQEESWGVGEHTDYGLLTLLAQDDCGGLQVKSSNNVWIEAPPIPNTLVCNIGDMLDKLTGGWYRSTPHRVKNVSGKQRLSFPLFFDPDFESKIIPLPNTVPIDSDQDRARRWDNASVHTFEGVYGDYLLTKVGKVFPQLKQDMLK